MVKWDYSVFEASAFCANIYFQRVNKIQNLLKKVDRIASEIH